MDIGNWCGYIVCGHMVLISAEEDAGQWSKEGYILLSTQITFTFDLFYIKK